MAMSARHWRLVVVATGSGYFQVTEVAYLDAAGTDISIGGVASASSEYSSSYRAAYAFDKSTSTDYCSAVDAFPVRLNYTFTAAVDVARVRFIWASNATWLPRGMESLKLISSADGLSWTDYNDLRLVSGALAAGTTAVAEVLPRGVPAAAPLARARPLVSLPPAGPLVTVGMRARIAKDLEAGDGRGVVRGRTVEQRVANGPKVPVSRRVRLLRERDSALTREAWSKPDGTYEFTGLDSAQVYTALSYDHTGDLRAVTADRITPEVQT